MNRILLAGLVVGAFALPALAAVNKDGDKPQTTPCGEPAKDCAQANPSQAQVEPVVIYLDANGDELVRLPLSRFRKEKPEVQLPPSLEHD